MAAMTGLSLASTMLITVMSEGSCMALGVLNSRISAPPENPLPSPTITTALMAVFSAALAIPSTIPVRVACPSPLTGGLFSVMTAISPCSRYVAVMLVSPVIIFNRLFSPMIAADR